MHMELSLEQQLELRLLYDALYTFDRQDLIEAVMQERTARLIQERMFREIFDEMNLTATVNIAAADIHIPQSEEELVAVFGHVPSDEELEEYIQEQLECQGGSATMDVDIEAIALGVEE